MDTNNKPQDYQNPQDTNAKLQPEQQSKTVSDTDPATTGQGDNLNPQNIDQVLAEDQEQKTSADFDQTVREAEADTQTRQPGQSSGNNSNQHNNGRGGGN